MELAEKGLYVPDYIAGYDSPSLFILSVYALKQNRYSSMKERLLKVKSKEYFLGLERELDRDISTHYLNAKNQGCKDLVWSNEGLYLLDSIEEYKRLRNLFNKYSSSVTCLCCFRDVESYRKSYTEQLKKQGISLSDDKNSYRYLEADSWLFDYARKVRILEQVFDEVLTFPYDQLDNITAFLGQMGYSADNTKSVRLNMTQVK